MAQMEYKPNGKGIVAQKEYSLVVYSPMEKAWFYKRLFFEVVIIMVKGKKYSIKRYDVIQN